MRFGDAGTVRLQPGEHPLRRSLSMDQFGEWTVEATPTFIRYLLLIEALPLFQSLRGEFWALRFLESRGSR